MDLRQYVDNLDLQIFGIIQSLKKLKELDTDFKEKLEELTSKEELGAYQITFIRDVIEGVSSNFNMIIDSIEKTNTIRNLSVFQLQINGLQNLLGEDDEA